MPTSIRPAARILVVLAALIASRANLFAQSAEALAPIVGVWQSDTTNGVSALSTCTWTPNRAGVICEQIISFSDGPRHALNLYTFDPDGKRFVFYGVSRPGDPIAPTSLSVNGRIWTYGAPAAPTNGPATRTINDFSNPSVYFWRQESTTDGKTWTTVRGGQSKRVK